MKATDLAAALGVTSDEVTAARRVESSHSVAAKGMDKAARNRRVAEQLGLTVGELDDLRRLLNGDVSRRTGELLASLRRIAAMPPAAAPAPRPVQKGTKAKPSGTRAQPQPWTPPRNLRAEPVSTWSPETKVFVTDWGDRVHWRADCSGTRAFGKGGKVRQATLADRVCAGRSACEVCFGEAYSGSEFAAIGRLIDRLHGRIREDQPVRRQIAAKARSRFGAGAAKKTTTKGAARQRDSAAGKPSTERGRSQAAQPKLAGKLGEAAERVNAERRASAEKTLRRSRRRRAPDRKPSAS